MISDFLVDVLMLRQGSKVDEISASLHALKLLDSSCFSWKAFLLLNVERSDYIFDFDLRVRIQREICTQFRAMTEFAKTLDDFNLRLAVKQTTFLTTMEAVSRGDDTIAVEQCRFVRFSSRLFTLCSTH